MASQKSIEAVAPKRQRGRERVAAILDAAAQLFIEQGQAVTMTEIAARSGTAIGSLYRFFPTREALADVLLQRYAEHMRQALDALAARAPDLTPDALADALLALSLDLRTERAAAVVLADLHDASQLRQQLRQTMRTRVAGILVRAGRVPAERAADAALAVITVIRGAGALANQPNSAGAIAELRRLLQRYLAD
ncbi:TetR/AcrR family transcriptional regulator [Pseudoxanthomonas spadix]|uniref:TetR/AcrR family transcriptional regulator n=1 Tax=Pseudoxanthomonas spadix TaxID=415229 RepID=UPI000EFFBC76|nr:TetR/AcrR family transcriptional regulator [Pseudoxanthomonas spadix]MBP3975015.1 TetR/AcrR family transcriptional regulator [Pseudoxanthomonas spadix]RMW92826.1 TetR/AcrR family transcriptional regulator [Pseudoxanthomonas spadix]